MSKLTLNRVVIHALNKEQHELIKPSTIRKEALDSSKEPVIKLVSGVSALYGSKHNAAQYGTFKNDEYMGRFPGVFLEYANIINPSEEQFLSVSAIAMKELFKKAADSTPSSGGYILFVDYNILQERYFLIAMIKQKDGISLSDELEPEELTQLDLGRLNQAARINFGKLSEYRIANQKSQMDLNYLSFVSPQPGRTASGYFVTALGCARGATSSRATENLIKEGTKFFREHAKLKEHAREFKNNLVEYLEKKQQSGESIKLSEIEKLARGFIPAEYETQADEIAENLITHLNSEAIAVPVEFIVNAPMLYKYTHIKTKADNFELKFERGALGDDDTADIYYDRGQNRIIIKNIPEQTSAEIIKELDNRTKNNHES